MKSSVSSPTVAAHGPSNSPGPPAGAGAGCLGFDVLVCAGGWLLVPGDVGSNWSSGPGGDADVVAAVAGACALVVCDVGVGVGSPSGVRR